MKSLKKIKQFIRVILSNYLNLKIYFPQKNIYKNLETPDYDNIKAILNAKGILHIGAHRGSERYLYDILGKPVIWIEANPFIFKELELNLKEFKFQKAYNYLLYSVSHVKKEFFLSSNDNASSSIYNFSNEFLKGKIKFNDIRRNIQMSEKITLMTKTLDDVLRENKINTLNFDHCIIDVQGAEIEVLNGAFKYISNCKSITIEVSTLQFYHNSALWDEIKKFLKLKQFKPLRDPKKNHDDILFIKE